MDIATLFGIVAGFSLVLGAIFIHGSLGMYLDAPGAMIVLGGAFAATCVSFPMKEIATGFRAAFKVFAARRVVANEVVMTMVRVAEISRREGLLALENIQSENMILKKACQLIADNADASLIRDTVRIEISSMNKRHAMIQEMFKRMGSFCPAFGMIGTTIGLVQMLSHMDDPKSVGPAMATALLTTFYGTLMSNLIFLPMAAKLRNKSIEESLHLEIIFEGAKCILENNNPRLVYEKLSSFVAPKERMYNARRK